MPYYWPKNLGPEKTERLPVEAIPDPIIREEWAHYAGYGWDDDKIAEHLGIRPDTLTQYRSRYRRAVNNIL